MLGDPRSRSKVWGAVDREIAKPGENPGQIVARWEFQSAAARAVEMTVGAKPCGFRTHLGNRCAIPTFPPPRRLLDCFLNSNPERSFPQPSAQASFRLILRLEKTARGRSGLVPVRANAS